jgi:hypothetical protein
MAAEGLLAHVVVSKYTDHLPLHRQAGILPRHGVTLSRSTQCDWVRGVARACEPIVEEIKRQILTADYLQTDDTSVVVLGGGEGSFKGRLWTYLDPLGRQVLFEATATHERAAPEALFSSFRGYLQADAYKGYDGLYSSGRTVEVACWAHGRRRFKDALETDPRAAAVLALVQPLHAPFHLVPRGPRLRRIPSRITKEREAQQRRRSGTGCGRPIWTRDAARTG